MKKSITKVVSFALVVVLMFLHFAALVIAKDLSDESENIQDKPVVNFTAVPSVQSVSLNESALTLAVGTNATLVASIEPFEAVNKIVFWNSDNEDVAIVVGIGESAVIEVVSPGTTSVTVTTADGGFTASCMINVIIDIPMPPLYLTAIPGDGEVIINWWTNSNGGSPIIKYQVSNDNGENWRDTTDSSSYTFEGLTNDHEYTFIVRAVNEIGASYPSDPVNATPVEIFKVYGLNFTDTIEYGHSDKFVTTSSGGGYADGKLSYQSNDESVISVDFEGRLTAHKAGTAKITVIKQEDLQYEYASMFITVTKKSISVSGAILAPKVYDGTTKGQVTSVSFDGIIEELIPFWDFTPFVEYDNENAGSSRTATVSVYLTSNSADKYELDMDKNTYQILNQTIEKALGGTVSVPTVNDIPTQTSITVENVTNIDGTGQIIEYAIDQISGEMAELVWQTGNFFGNLIPNTTYYIYARTQANENYMTGMAQQSEAILTSTSAQKTFSVVFDTVHERGQLTASVDGIEYPSGTMIEEGKAVIFAAVPNSGYRISAWTDNGSLVNETNNTYTIYDISDNHYITLKFDVRIYNVTVISDGENHYGSGISPFKNWTHIGAGEAPTNKRFSHWETSSDGVNFNSPTSSETYFIMPANDVTVTAVFENIIPTVESVAVSPSILDVQTGMSYIFDVEVQGENNPSQAVLWSVINGNGITSIDSNGKLTVDANESASTLTIKATSLANNAKSGIATVVVIQPPATPTVLSVEIEPSTATVEKGSTYTFVAHVIGENDPPQALLWSVSGGTDETSIDVNGILTVSETEKADTLVVKAISVFDSSKFSTVFVTVPQIPATVVPPVVYPQVPTITISPQSAIAYIGDKVLLSVAAVVTDGGVLSYQWYRNDANSNIGGILINGATDKVYSPLTSLIGTSYYYVIITNTLTGATSSNMVYATSNPAAVTVNYYYSGGSNNDSESSNNNSGDADKDSGAVTDSSIDNPSVEVGINSQKAILAVNEDGILEIDYMDSAIQKFANSSGDYTIEIAEQDYIMFSTPIPDLGTGNLTIQTDFGTVTIPNKTLQSISKQYGDILRLIIKKGSFTIFLIDADGKEIKYNDPDNPFKIVLPYTLADGQKANSVIAVKKSGERNIIIPLSEYKYGYVTFHTGSTGIFDAIYNPRTYTDTENHREIDSIFYVSARGLFSGTGNGAFSPNETMTRAMFLTILARIAGADLSQYTSSRFADVSLDLWFAASVEWAASVGLVVGVGDGNFAPNAPITREQMAVVLDRFIKISSYRVTPLPEVTSFVDGENISTWAVEAVKNIHHFGVIEANADSIFNPQGVFRRAETAAVFVRLIETMNR